MVTIADRTEIAPQTVLFDPAALEGFFTEEPEPARAFRKFPRRLDREVRSGNAFRSYRWGAEVRVREPSAVFTPPADAEEIGEEARLLNVPSGRIFSAGSGPLDDEADGFQARPVAEVPPGTYRVRTFTRRLIEDRKIELQASARLSDVDQAALRSYRDGSRYELWLLPLAALLIGLPLAIATGLPAAVPVGVAVTLFLVLVPLPFGIVTACREPVRSLRGRLSLAVASVQAELWEAWGESGSIHLIEPEAETS